MHMTSHDHRSVFRRGGEKLSEGNPEDVVQENLEILSQEWSRQRVGCVASRINIDEVLKDKRACTDECYLIVIQEGSEHWCMAERCAACEDCES